MIQTYLEKITDPRRAQAKRYPLSYLLLFSILAILCGADSYRDICRFMDKKREALNKHFGLQWKSSPSKSQLRDTLCAIKINDIEGAFRGYGQALVKLNKQVKNRIGLDGKSLRGSFDHIEGTSMLQLLSAFCSESKLILGHTAISEKTNDIPTAQTLIKELGLPTGTVYTADALHCQKNL